ncbi:acyl-CoA carboxylase subunit epsilon [Nocardia stercoris]|uniref:Acyl-CoA carboxylase subunit epsilon n=1 Tax=Nocardia stercoris TaxID=2483361 RepID=A0A3M2L5M2_9NOCA|nr:acyl-CoA carboxylase subunit epsilon [Nocardia stercoris]RMI31175.1 acyl-CoA carboxylase subunit epsilon [Nocardia stercoris]
MSAATPPFLRVEKGHPDLEELGVLTALLYARTRSGAAESAPPRTAARWRRPERHPAFTDPRAWTTSAARR